MYTKSIANIAGWVIALLASLVAPSSDGAPILNVASLNSAVGTGSMFSLGIEITSADDLFAFQFDLAFDPTILSAVSVREGSLLPGAGATSFVPGLIDNVLGTVTITGSTLLGAIDGVSGEGVLALIELKALTVGITSITLSNLVLLDSTLTEITADTIAGSVTVVGAVVGGRAGY